MRLPFVAVLFLITLSAQAVEPAPKHVFIRDTCDGPLGSEIVSSLRQQLRASGGYQVANALTDDGGYSVVITVYLSCVESVLPTGERVASVASIFGTGTCTAGSCTVTSNESTLGAELCSGRSGAGCGKDLYVSLDRYMNKSGGYIFNVLSDGRRRAFAGQ